MLSTARRVFVPLCLLASGALAQTVPDPTTHLGRPLGVDFELADWEEVSSYFKLVGQASPNVDTHVVGTTTEGREFLLSTISSSENLANVERLREYARLLADPRGRSAEERAQALREGKVILFISCAMHATETAAPQMAMRFAYDLATSNEEPWVSARENVVCVLAPSLNPDGLDHVVSWYRETVGTPYEASGLLKLYQFYTGHDNNRDWFMLSQAETRIVTEQLYSVWFPQVYWDVHQQGTTRERLFVPPFRDPLNPNLDASIITGIQLIGSRAMHDLTAQGFKGVSTGVSYDMWWNGGNRNVPVRHNIVGLLTEAASVRIATPVFLPRSELSGPRGLGQYGPSNRFPDPWEGGWWRLRDIIDYELAFGRSLLGTLSRERELWLAGAARAAERTIDKGLSEAPRAWVIPSDNRDPAAVRRLADVLLLSGVELEVASADFNADGRTWPQGSIVIRRDQPYGSHVKDLFEVQKYPEGEPPYDVAGWTLPFLLGVHRVEVVEALSLETRRVTTGEAALAAFGGDPRADGQAVLSLASSATWTAMAAALAAGRDVAVVADGERAGLVVDPAQTDGNERALVVSSLPRIGVYAPWYGSMDEGWLRWVLDTFEIPFVRVRNEMLRAGKLADFMDVLVVASTSGRQLDRGRSEGSVPSDFTGGLDPEGAIAIEEFVRTGGRLVTLGSSSAWAIDLFELPLVDVTRGDEADGFTCPGSVLRTIPAARPQLAGTSDSIAIFFSRSSAWRRMTSEELEDSRRSEASEPRTLLAYAATRLLLSGWIAKPQTVEDRAAWVYARHGDGGIHLFGFRPQYRGWSQAGFGLLFRALFLPFDD